MIKNDCTKTHVFKSLRALRGIFSLLKYTFALSYNIRGMNQIQELNLWATWMALLVKYPALDFVSGHDFGVGSLNPVSGSMLSGKCA